MTTYFYLEMAKADLARLARQHGGRAFVMRNCPSKGCWGHLRVVMPFDTPREVSKELAQRAKRLNKSAWREKGSHCNLWLPTEVVYGDHDNDPLWEEIVPEEIAAEMS